jgi:hypothetical protein
MSQLLLPLVWLEIPYTRKGQKGFILQYESEGGGNVWVFVPASAKAEDKAVRLSGVEVAFLKLKGVL